MAVGKLVGRRLAGLDDLDVKGEVDAGQRMIRIEDDLIVTENGYENLTASLPRHPDVPSPREGAQAPRIRVRGSDDAVCGDAGEWPRGRPPGGLFPEGPVPSLMGDFRGA